LKLPAPAESLPEVDEKKIEEVKVSRRRWKEEESRRTKKAE